MPFIEVSIIEDVFTPEQKNQIISRLTDVLVSIEGENMRAVTWCVVREVASGVGTTLIGDGYCPLARGDKLAGATTAEIAVSVLGGSAALLDDRGRAVPAWARKLATEPRAVTPADVDDLIEAGFDRAQILRLTLFIALRIAFSTVNGALGARPEAAYVEHVDPAVWEAWERLPARR